MAKLMFDAPNCQGADLPNGHRYNADRQGFLNVTNPADIKALKDGGYLEAGGLPHGSKYWECECGWQSHINSCPKCSRNDLTKVELRP